MGTTSGFVYQLVTAMGRHGTVAVLAVIGLLTLAIVAAVAGLLPPEPEAMLVAPLRWKARMA